MIEVLVCVAVIMVLAAILMPAVQNTRAVMRRTACSDRLRQIVLASQNFEATTGRTAARRQEMHREFLPYLEQSPLYEVLTDNYGGWPEGADVPVFRCPSDPLADRVRGPMSYPPNDGLLRLSSTASAGALVWEYRPLPSTRDEGVVSADITDGHSNTAQFAERLYELNHVSRLPEEVSDSRRVVFHVSRVFATDEGESFAAECSATSGFLPDRGHFQRTRLRDGLYYTHDLPPNANSCYNASAYDDAMAVDVHGGATILSASSLHSGGVNVAFFDGSCRFVTNSIDLPVWQALGTSAGAD